MSIVRYKTRFWAVYDRSGALVCVCVYRKGAREVLKRLTALDGETALDRVTDDRDAERRAA